jgi:hypothetical protein
VTRSILEIAIEAAERDATAPAPTTLFDTNTRIAKILRTAAKDIMRDYLTRSNWTGMSELSSTWVFAMQAGRYAYTMPPDFLRIIPGTEQRNGWPMGLLGPASPQQWAWWIHGGSASVAPHGWRIRNNLLWIDPTPQADELVAIEYVSRYPVVSAIQDGDINLSTTPLQINAPAVSRDGWLKLDDASLVQESNSANFKYDEEPGFDVGVWPKEPEEILKRIHLLSEREPAPQVRRAEFTADTDTPAFDDDYILSVGMTFHLQRALGLPYAERAAEYENQVEHKIATDAGGGRGFRLGNSGDTWDCWPLDANNDNGNTWIVS